MGEDCGLKSQWEEICVIAREGGGGDLYEIADQTIHMAIHKLVEPLQPYEKSSLWLESDSGFNWVYDQTEISPAAQVEQVTYNLDEVIDYLSNEFVWPEAINWTNSRIRHHEDRQYEMDDFFN